MIYNESARNIPKAASLNDFKKMLNDDLAHFFNDMPETTRIFLPK